jgi:hypothetical protein
LSRRDDLLLVSLGGCDCSLYETEADAYPALMLQVLEQALAEAPDSNRRVLVCCGEHAACALRPQRSEVSIQTLPKQDYIQALRCARAAVLSPGLNGAMEAFEAATPAFFLPPHNYSQLLQLKVYRQVGAAPYGFTWSDMDTQLDLPAYLPEEEGVRQVNAAVQRLAHDEQAQAVFRQRRVDFLKNGISSYEPEPALVYRRSLGMNGPRQAADLIQTCLRNNTGRSRGGRAR